MPFGNFVDMLKRIKKSVLHVLTPYSVAHENWVTILLRPKRRFGRNWNEIQDSICSSKIELNTLKGLQDFNNC